ncbi:MAG: hypothetical protein ACLGHS_10010 [Actinomycetes bacterium]
MNNVGKGLFNNFPAKENDDDGGGLVLLAPELSCYTRERPNSRLSQLVPAEPFSRAAPRGLTVEQVQRSLLGTPRMTWSTWLPQPLQVVLRQYMHVVVRHIVTPFVDPDFP